MSRNSAADPPLQSCIVQRERLQTWSRVFLQRTVFKTREIESLVRDLRAFGHLRSRHP